MEAEWYETVNQSRVVTVPPPVTDLHIGMLPTDTTAPVIVNFLINNGELVTNSRNITLTLSVTDDKSGANKMWVSNDETFSSGSWESFSTTKLWTLPDSSGGDKKVYIRVKDKCGNTTQTSATIKYSTAADDLLNVKVYPNPYKPGATGEDAKFADTSKGVGIVFDGLTKKASIKIYNIAGELVAELDETDGDGWYLWDTMNKGNEKVASGVYIYYITNPDNSSSKPAKGKFAIIR